MIEATAKAVVVSKSEPFTAQSRLVCEKGGKQSNYPVSKEKKDQQSCRFSGQNRREFSKSHGARVRSIGALAVRLH